jgi:hypothetical protein
MKPPVVFAETNGFIIPLIFPHYINFQASRLESICYNL